MQAIAHAPLRLHGYPVSNYFNAVRAALIEQQRKFDIVLVRASQDPAFLAKSPMGKIPVLETPSGWISETVAILEYLEDTGPALRLHPVDPFARARARQAVNIIQMYVEGPVRSLFPGVFGHASNAPELVESARHMLVRAVAALERLHPSSAFLLGPDPGLADLFGYYSMDIADRVTRHVYGQSLLQQSAALRAWFDRMGQRASTRVVMGDFDIAFKDYLVEKNSPYRCPNL
jgi:glutathione S-transferase